MYNIGLLTTENDRLVLKELYIDIKDINTANSLAQFAIHNKKSDNDLVVICPSYTNDPVLLENGRVADLVYNNSKTFPVSTEVNNV